jgi:hypothetical protein
MLDQTKDQGRQARSIYVSSRLLNTRESDDVKFGGVVCLFTSTGNRRTMREKKTAVFGVLKNKTK